MRSFTSIVLLIITQIAIAQDYDPGNLDRQKGVTTVFKKVLCENCKDRVHVASFVFDKTGLNTEAHFMHNGKKNGAIKYFWNTDGTINSAHRYFTNSNGYPDDDSDADVLNSEKSVQTWDSTKISQEVRYSYAGPRLDKITWLDGEEQSISQEINLYYDNTGKVARQDHIISKAKGTVIGFKQNEREITDLPAASTEGTYSKTYRYAADSIFIEYLNKGAKSGTGKQRINKAGKILYEAIYNTTGKMIYESRKKYNQSNKIIEQTLMDSGHDGYGNEFEAAGFDKIAFRYDALGRLAIVVKSLKGKDKATDFYEYR